GAAEKFVQVGCHHPAMIAMPPESPLKRIVTILTDPTPLRPIVIFAGRQNRSTSGPACLVRSAARRQSPCCRRKCWVEKTAEGAGPVRPIICSVGHRAA